MRGGEAPFDDWHAPDPQPDDERIHRMQTEYTDRWPGLFTQKRMLVRDFYEPALTDEAIERILGGGL